MLDVDLQLNTCSIESFLALIKKFAPPVVVVQDASDQTVPMHNYHTGLGYSASFDTLINGRAALCSLQVLKSSQHNASSKSEVLQYLSHIGVPEEQFAVLKKTTMKKLKEATHEQISEEEERLTVHSKESLGVYNFTSPRATIKVNFDLVALTQGQTRATIFVDYRKEISDFTKMIKEAMADGCIVIEDATMQRNVHKSNGH